MEMAASHDEKSGLFWSLVSWGAGILAALVVGWIVAAIFGEAAAGIVFGGVTFVIVAWVLSRYLGPPADDEVPHLPHLPAESAAVHVAAPAPAAAPVHTPTPPAASAPEAGVISERVREAARAAGEAARAAVADVAPEAPAAEPEVEPVRPASMAEAREGGPDDLKKIKGVGPKLEEMLHGLGFWHFDQIAAWTPAEIAWVDGHLEGFNGRATRDDWVGQSTVLASGGQTEFSQRVDRGEVY